MLNTIKEGQMIYTHFVNVEGEETSNLRRALVIDATKDSFRIESDDESGFGMIIFSQETKKSRKRNGGYLEAYTSDDDYWEAMRKRNIG